MELNSSKFDINFLTHLHEIIKSLPHVIIESLSSASDALYEYRGKLKGLLETKILNLFDRKAKCYRVSYDEMDLELDKRYDTLSQEESIKILNLADYNKLRVLKLELNISSAENELRFYDSFRPPLGLQKIVITLNYFPSYLNEEKMKFPDRKFFNRWSDLKLENLSLIINGLGISSRISSSTSTTSERSQKA